ncbi:MAG: hypothetical protein BWY76_03209 [bacterium ADurb.Bin429]|nr:MAG: hypothetical protein BWY76_03209 [bacterium ADurb.Bin429]
MMGDEDEADGEGQHPDQHDQEPALETDTGLQQTQHTLPFPVTVFQHDFVSLLTQEITEQASEDYRAVTTAGAANGHRQV